MLILVQLARFTFHEHFILLFGTDKLVESVLFLLVEDVCVLSLLIHLLLALVLLEFSILLHLVHVPSTSDLSVFFFPLLIDFSHAFLLLNTLFGLLSHIITNIGSFFIVSLPPLHVLLGLDQDHVSFLQSILFFPSLDLLLALELLIIKVHLEGILQLA